jgi:hypothetical protein
MQTNAILLASKPGFFRKSVSENCNLAAAVLYGRRLRCFSLTYFLSNTLARRVSPRPQTPRRHHDRSFQARSKKQRLAARQVN